MNLLYLSVHIRNKSSKSVEGVSTAVQTSSSNIDDASSEDSDSSASPSKNFSLCICHFLVKYSSRKWQKFNGRDEVFPYGKKYFPE